MDSRLYTITPLDTLFFRDGRPFVAGEGTDAASLFPPTPFTVQGLIRSKLLANEKGCTKGWAQYEAGCGTCPAQQSCQVKDVVGSLDGRDGSLRVKGPWITVGYASLNKDAIVQETVLLPCPTDLIALDDDLKPILSNNEGSVQTAMLVPSLEDKFCNLPGELKRLVPPIAWEGRDFVGVGGWLSWDAFEEYLRGSPPKLILRENWWRDQDLWHMELRPGLEMERGRNRAKQGQLYFAQHIRLEKNVRLMVELSDLGPTASLLLAPAYTPFGGERRSVILEEHALKEQLWGSMDSLLKQAIKDSGRVKLVITQIAWFESGWAPLGWDEKTATAQLDGTTCTWVAARVERPEVIGGWDLALREQKPVRRFVPKGSVYYLNLTEQTDLDKVLAQWNAPISETLNRNRQRREPFDFQSVGLGHVFLGTWQEENRHV